MNKNAHIKLNKTKPNRTEQKKKSCGIQSKRNGHKH